MLYNFGKKWSLFDILCIDHRRFEGHEEQPPDLTGGEFLVQANRRPVAGRMNKIGEPACRQRDYLKRFRHTKRLRIISNIILVFQV